jgi:lipopolysaccharide export system permease protein
MRFSLNILKPTIITVYIVKHLTFRFLILTGGILSLVYLITFVEMMRKTNNNMPITFVDMLSLSFSQLPPVIDKIFPFLILLSSLWSIFSLLKTSELIILKASAVSLWHIARTYFIASFMCAVVYVFALMPILAHLHHNYRDWESNQMRISNNINKKIIISDNKIVFLNIDQFDTVNNTLKDVHITFLDKNHLLQDVYYAPVGIYNQDDKTIIFDTITMIQTNTVMLEPEHTISHFSLDVSLDTAHYDTNKQEITGIYDYSLLIANQKQQKLSIRSLTIVFYNLLFLPLTCGIYSFIGIASVPHLYRGFKNIKNIMVALLSGLLFYILDNWIMAIAGNDILPLLMALITIKMPVILFCIVIIFNKEYGFTKQ